MALTQADLDSLDAAIATGELVVEYNGRKVQFRSIPDLLAARAHVSSVLATSNTAGSATRRGSYRVSFTTARGD